MKRTGRQRDELITDLPGVPLPVQIFVVGIIIFLWDMAVINANR